MGRPHVNEQDPSTMRHYELQTDSNLRIDVTVDAYAHVVIPSLGFLQASLFLVQAAAQIQSDQAPDFQKLLVETQV